MMVLLVPRTLLAYPVIGAPKNPPSAIIPAIHPKAFALTWNLKFSFSTISTATGADHASVRPKINPPIVAWKWDEVIYVSFRILSLPAADVKIIKIFLLELIFITKLLWVSYATEMKKCRYKNW